MMKLMEELNKKSNMVKKDEIYYVLTVPAIWNDNAKQFMRQVAEQVTCSFNHDGGSVTRGF